MISRIGTGRRSSISGGEYTTTDNYTETSSSLVQARERLCTPWPP
jgi:hypothetical protein